MRVTDHTVIEREAEALAEALAGAEKKLKTLPEGRLYISKGPKGSACYRRGYHSKDGVHHVKYLNKNDCGTIADLAEKTYLQRLIPVIKREIKALNAFEKDYNPEEKEIVWQKLESPLKEYVDPVFIGAEEADRLWREEKYEKNDDHPEGLIFKTQKGDPVRSKTEVIIADMLYFGGIAYRYEAVLYLSAFYTCYPDFTIRRKKDGKIFYWEHLGLLDDSNYLERVVYKLNQYAHAGIFLGDNLLLTWETALHPFDRAAAERYIKSLLS